MTSTVHSDEHHRHTTMLVNAFLSSATIDFEFLIHEPEGRWELRVQHSTPDGLADVAPEQIAGFFFASASFANRRVAGEITFGDRDYFINTVVGAACHPARYALWEWADALGMPNLVPRDTNLVTTVERLKTIVAQMATGMRELGAQVAAADAAILDRMDRARGLLRDQFAQRLLEDEHLRVSTLAAEAFRAHDYRRVVALLESVRGELTAAERGKLAYAKRRT